MYTFTKLHNRTIPSCCNIVLGRYFFGKRVSYQKCIPDRLCYGWDAAHFIARPVSKFPPNSLHRVAQK